MDLLRNLFKRFYVLPVKISTFILLTKEVYVGYHDVILSYTAHILGFTKVRYQSMVAK